MNDFTLYLKQAESGQPFAEDVMRDAMHLIMDGKADDDELAAFLVALAERGETAEEITGAARVLREKVAHIKAPADAVDCCGTGGDGTGTYNISTAVALVTAACGAPEATVRPLHSRGAGKAA